MPRAADHVPASDEHALQCMEVWGGNQLANSAVRLAGLDAWVYSRPYRQEAGGGDVYYVSSCATGRITRLLALRDLMRDHVNHLDQVKFVRRMNAAFVQRSAAGSFATAVVTTFFGPTRSLSLCNAGHPPPLLYRAKSREWSYLEIANPRASVDQLADVPLGIVDLADYQQFDVDLQPGDLVLCYTDGLPEARLADDPTSDSTDLLGQAGLLDVVRSIDLAQHAADPTTLIPALLDAIESRCRQPLAGDDVSVLLFRPNLATEHIPWRDRLLAPARILRAAFASIADRRFRIPLPDHLPANWLGAMMPAIEKRKRRDQA
jgi:phosphoserine phosphatase RsbU/P